MVRKSAETEQSTDKIYKRYAERKMGSKKLLKLFTEETNPEVEMEKDQKAQEMLENIFEHADTIQEAEYKKILTLPDLRLLIETLKPSDLEDANAALDSKGKNPDEVLTLLKKMLDGLDSTTCLQNRFALNDSIRQNIIDIINTKDEATRTEKMRRSGMIYFDVRGLKMVNDARHDHSDGDAFISMVSDETRVVAEQIFTKILGDQAVAGIFRDGGDEFAITLQDAKYDLEEKVTAERIAEIFPETITVTRQEKTTKTVNGKKVTEVREVTEVEEIRSLAMEVAELSETETGTSPFNLIEVLSKILEQKLFDQKFVSEMFPREVIENHLKKGRPNYKNEALETFDMPALTAQGAQTNYEVFKKTKHSYHKNLLSAEEIEKLSASGVVNTLMSAMRLSGDQKSYDAKNLQNRTWMDSDDPLEQLLIDLVSRNEITTGYADSLRVAKEVVSDLHFTKKTLKEKLKKEKNKSEKWYKAARESQVKCDELNDKLTKIFSLLVKKLDEIAYKDTELAKTKAIIKAIEIEKDRQLNPDLTDGGGI